MTTSAKMHIQIINVSKLNNGDEKLPNIFLVYAAVK
jgi:hypothetical protein